MSHASCMQREEEGEQPHYKIVEAMKKDGDRQEPLVPVIAGMLQETVLHNDQNRTTNSRTYSAFQDLFNGRQPPLVSASLHKQNYLINLRTNAHYTINAHHNII